jgi:hypothetical protein
VWLAVQPASLNRKDERMKGRFNPMLRIADIAAGAVG